jgi:hypothetical protein
VQFVEMGSLVVGLVLAVVIASDVVLTVLHPDIEGPVSKAVQRTTWNTFAFAARKLQRVPRGLLALAGPVVIVVTLTVWVALTVLGFGLIFYSGIGDFRVEEEIAEPGFLEALYFAGGTVTILGYGDLTPAHGSYQLVSIVAASIGFALFTGTVTYLLELTSTIGERHRFTALVHDDTEGTQRGVTLALAGTETGDVAYLRDRYEAWAVHLRDIRDRIHRYAVVVLYYRSRDPVYDLEPVLRICAEATAAGYVVAEDERWRSLGPSVRHLDASLRRLLDTIAASHLGAERVQRVENSPVEPGDQRVIRSLYEALGTPEPPDVSDGHPALQVVARANRLLEEIDRITAWTQALEHADPVRGERDR